MTDLLNAIQQLAPGSFDAAAVRDRFGDVDIDDTPERTRLTYKNANDWVIPLGTWRLRLLSRLDEATGGEQIVMDLVKNAGGDITSVRIDLLRFELEADPDHLWPGHLRTEPFTHVEPIATSGPNPPKVRLLGPGMTIGLRGSNFDEPFVDFNGATGGVEPRLPSMRFDPPHFLVGNGSGIGDFVGIACDECLLDLSTTISPPGPQGTTFAPTWTGLYIKELGVFLNNSPDNDTWSFMARMQEFFIGFYGFDLSGTLSAELVHHVVDNPQVALEVQWEDDAGNIDDLLATPLPAPTKKAYRRVRLVARPSWDSAGFSVQWTLPDGVVAEEPLRLDQPDLGWVDVVPGTHSVSVKVTDHRVPDQTVTQTLAVGSPTAQTHVQVEAIVTVIAGNQGGGDGEPHRVHIDAPVGSQLRLVAKISGGDSTRSVATVSLDPGGLNVVTGSLSSTVNRDPQGRFPNVEWQLAVTEAANTAGALGVGVELKDAAGAASGATHVGTRRLRYFVEATPDNRPDAYIEALSDRLPEPGPSLARLALYGGVTDQQVSWELASVGVSSDDLDSVGWDELFDPVNTAATIAPRFWSAGVAVTPALAGNTARTSLLLQERLWRLKASTGGQAPKAQLILVGEARGSHRLAFEPLAGLWATPGSVQQDGDQTPFRFAYDSDGLQTLDRGLGPDRPTPETASQAWVKQAAGARALVQAIASAGTLLREVHLVGAASAEGDASYNAALGQSRAAAVKTFLEGVRSGATPAWANVDAAVASAASAALAGPVTFHLASVGESGAQGGVGTETVGATTTASGASIAVDDRRVVAVLKLAAAPSVPAHARYTYFLTDPGVAPINTPAPIPARVSKHPFEHAVFRAAHLEVELLHSDLLRAQVRLTVDLKRFNDSDGLDPSGSGDVPLNPADGITTFFLEYKKILDPAGTRWQWDAAVLADPQDKNGLAVTEGVVAAVVGPPLVTLPAVTALAGGHIGGGAALGAVALGAAMAALGVIKAKKIIWQGVRGRLGYGKNPPVAIRIGADYTVQYLVDVDLGPIGRIRTDADKPLKVTFRNLGLTWTSPDRFDLDYDPMTGFALRVDDPGVFRLGDGIGKLLSVQSAGTGIGSPMWLEVELRFAIETGVFKVDSLKIRLSLESDKLFQRDSSGSLQLVTDGWASAVSVTISKIGMSAKVPGVLEGRGQLEISGSGGNTTVAGDLDISLIPLKMGLGASFAMFSKSSPPRRAVYLGIQAHFSPGFPLGTTGVALYGLLGLTGVNIGRSITEPERVLEWYKQSPKGVRDTSKWVMRDGAWVFGVGATLGTAVDGGITWNTAGALLVQTPGPQIMLAADSQFLTPTADPESPLSAGLQTVILLDFENGVFMAALELNLTKSPIIELVVPAEVYFNLRRSVDWHIHLGQWQPENKRVRAKLFGGIFEAWSYIQIEGDGFSGPVTLQGLCVAHGMRTSVFWGSRGSGIYLEAWIEYHLGLQLTPLYVEGVLTAGGELHLGPVSIGADVKVHAKVGKDPDILSLHGKACGHIDLWLFEIRGCVGVDIGDGARNTPDPKNPLTKFSVIDVLTDTTVDANAAPVDCALHLVFDQPVFDARGADAAVDLGVVRRVQVSPDLYYEYDLTALSIDNGAAIRPAVWAQPPIPDPDPAHADGAHTLRLRAWEPTPFPKALDFKDGYDQELLALMQRLCSPVRPPVRHCATFDDQPFGPGSRWHLTRPNLVAVDVLAPAGGMLGAGALTPTASTLGVAGAAVVALPAVTFPSLVPKSRALRLSAGAGTAIDGQMGLSTALISTRATTSGAASLLGLVMVRLPDLVSAEAMLLMPKKRRGGSYRFYDDGLHPLTPELDFSTAPVVPATVSGAVKNDEVRSLLFDGFAIGTKDQPARAAWLIIKSSQPMRYPPQWDAHTYLLQVCGVAYGDWLSGQRIGQTRDDARSWVQDALVTPAAAAMATTVPMLQPATTYTLSGTIAWRRYRDASTATTDGSGSFNISQTFRTRATPPLDIRPYIDYVDPADTRQPQYRAEHLVVRFRSDDIDRLFEVFGKQVVTRLKADLGGDVSNMGRTEGRFVVHTALTSFEQAFADAVEGTPCISGDPLWFFGKTEIRSTHELAPNTGYTLSLVPRPLAEPGTTNPAVWDHDLAAQVESAVPGAVLYRSTLTASRWRNFAEHMAAYAGAAASTAGGALHLLADSFTAASAMVGTLSAMSRGDLQVDAVLGALVSGPISLPAAPEVHWIWGLSTPAANGRALPGYTLLGLMLDGPEPLMRLRPTGEDSVRVSLSGGGGGATLKVVAGTTGSRVLLFAATAGPGNLSLQFDYQRLAGDPTETHVLTLPIPSAPGVAI